MSKSGRGSVPSLPVIIQDDMRKKPVCNMKNCNKLSAKWQNRLFILNPNQLVYKSRDGKQEKGCISLTGIKLCEDVASTAFDKEQVFQVGFMNKGNIHFLYIQAKSEEMKERWKKEIRE